MRIYLVQHGKSRAKEEDPEKPLNETGKADTEKTASAIKGKVSVTRILCSKKLRAKQTAEIFGRHIGAQVKEVEGIAPLDDVSIAEGMLGDGLMIVGHLPHLAKFSGKLLTGGENEIIRFANSAVLCLEKKENWQVVWYVPSEMLS